MGNNDGNLRQQLLALSAEREDFFRFNDAGGLSPDVLAYLRGAVRARQPWYRRVGTSLRRFRHGFIHAGRVLKGDRRG